MITTHFTAPFKKSKQRKGSNKSTHCQRSQAIKAIVALLRSKGLKAEGSAKTSKAFADVFADFSGKPLEVKVITKRLSPAQSQYRRAVENAGAYYVAVANAEDFRAWYQNSKSFRS